MFARSATAFVLAACSLLAGCASTTPIDKPIWPQGSSDEVQVRQSLQQLVREHPNLKVVLRVPNVTTTVTQSAQAQNANSTARILNSAYDEIEKKLFEAGFVVRDRALLTSLLSNEGIASYKEIQSRVDTDLIIDISSLRFNQPEDWVTTKSYLGPSGPAVLPFPYEDYSMGEAVATVEAKFVIVATGEVGGIVDMHVPICSKIPCPFTYFQDDFNSTDDLYISGADKDSAAYDQASRTLTYIWKTGSGRGSINYAAGAIGDKIANILKAQ